MAAEKRLFEPLQTTIPAGPQRAANTRVPARNP
jgi:hypothetical protein